MKLIYSFKRLGLLSCISLFFFQANSQGFLHTEGKKIINENGEVLLKGIGLGGWMLQEPYMLKLSGVEVNQTDIRSKIQEPGRSDFAHTISKGCQSIQNPFSATYFSHLRALYPPVM